MKHWACLFAVAIGMFLATPAEAEGRARGPTGPRSGAVRVRAHQVRTSHGTRFEKASRRTRPNRRKNDNYSTAGNRNPFTGKKGTRKRSPRG